jgi:hypothetical protein
MAWRPVPTIPILIWLLGAVFPKTEEGTTVGSTTAPTMARELFFRKSLLDVLLSEFMISVLRFNFIRLVLKAPPLQGWDKSINLHINPFIPNRG